MHYLFVIDLRSCLCVTDTFIADYKRILSLRDPQYKMSKSSPDTKSRILLTDSASSIQKKIASAVTDSNMHISFDPLARPGVSNLLTILSGLLQEDIPSIERRCEGLDHAGLKKLVVDALEEKWARPRREFERLKDERGYLEGVLEDGAQRARVVSHETLRRVESALGLCLTLTA
jgi:tryptophanyl-tRNA synthetase